MTARGKRSLQSSKRSTGQEKLEALELLSPLVAFLRASGVSDQNLQDGFSAALDRAKRASNRIEVVRMGAYYRRGEIIDRWLRNPTFVNKAGKPLDLPLNGKLSITSLTRLAGLKESPRSILRLLVKFGNVTRTSSGRYRLVKRYMNYKAPGLLPFEPNVQFISDAISSATRGLGNRKASKELFWLNAEHSYIPAVMTKQFLRYVHSRGIVFLHEVNDWLDQYAEREPTESADRKRLRRIGVGLFPFCSNA